MKYLLKSSINVLKIIDDDINYFLSKKSKIFFNLSVFSKLGLAVRNTTKIIIRTPTLDTPNKSCWNGFKDSSITSCLNRLNFINDNSTKAFVSNSNLYVLVLG